MISIEDLRGNIAVISKGVPAILFRKFLFTENNSVNIVAKITYHLNKILQSSIRVRVRLVITACYVVVSFLARLLSRGSAFHFFLPKLFLQEH